jgi:hypothetical protein
MSPAIGAANLESVRAVARVKDAAPLATAVRSVAGTVEAQVHADQRRRRRRRLNAPTNALNGGACCGPLAGRAGPGGERFQLVKASSS